MKYILLILMTVSNNVYADKWATPSKLKIGDSVRVASCKSRNGSIWVSTGYPSAKLVPIESCGQRGVIVGGPRRACAPGHLNIDSCDPWEYTVLIKKTSKKYILNEFQLGVRKKQQANTLMDFIK